MSTSRKRFGLKMFAFTAVALMFLSGVYLVNDADESDAGTVTWSDYSSKGEITVYVGDTLNINYKTHQSSATGPLTITGLSTCGDLTELEVTGSKSVTCQNPATGQTKKVYVRSYSGTITCAPGDYELTYHQATAGVWFNTFKMTVHVLATYSVTFSSNNTNYGTVNQSSINVPSGASLTKSNNTVAVNGTTCTASAKSATAQYTYAFSKWQYSTNGGSSWSDLGSSLTVTSDIKVRALFTATVNSYQVKYYYGSSQITSYTETIQYNSHITHGSYSVSGKVFCGWYKSSSSFTSANLVTTSTAVTGALTLYAYMVDTIAFTSSPVANATITYASDLGCVLFDALESQSPAKVLWDFGDGTYGYELVEYHHYEEPGTYNVLLSVFNYNGELDTKEYVIAVYDVENPPEKGDNTLLIVGCTAALILASFAIIRPF